MPTLLSAEGFYFPPVNRSSVPFSNILSSVKTWWKATDVPQIIPACPLSCLIFKGRRKDTEKGKETKPRFKSSHHFALEQICLHMLRWPGRKGRTSTFSCGLIFNAVLSGPRAFHRKQLPLVARTNWGDSSYQRGRRIISMQGKGGKSSEQTNQGCPQ